MAKRYLYPAKTGDFSTPFNIEINQKNLRNAGPEDLQFLFYKKVLMVTALDTLAGIRFPKVNYPDLHNKNPKRFIRFISEYGSWEHGELVSTPFLLDSLSTRNTRNGKLAEYLRDKMNGYDSNSGNYFKLTVFDETPSNLLDYATTENEENLIWCYQHYAIFYRYRNFLVHEARTPGYAMDGIRNNENGAFYHGYIGNALEGWHLAYPVELFVTLLSNSTNGLRDFFQEQNQSPYAFVGDTTRW